MSTMLERNARLHECMLCWDMVHMQAGNIVHECAAYMRSVHIYMHAWNYGMARNA